MGNLNDDVLEKIFTYLDFRSLIAAEMVCKRWREVINERRLFWQLSKTLVKRAVPITFDNSVFRRERRKLKQRGNLWPSKRRKME